MSTTPDIATMQLLLRQGRWPACLSLGLLLVALLLLGTEPGLAMVAAGWLLASMFAGAAQTYHAWRVALDASLLQLLRDEGLDGDAAARRTDQLLQDSGLRRAAPDAPLRGWDARWAGMRRLLLRQYLLTAVQVVLLVLAVVWPQT